MGTTLAVGGEAGLLDEEGNMPQINRPFMVDSIAAALGPWVGIPAATALIESSAAAEAGGKTGLTALSAAVMFLLMLLFTPVALMIPKEATAPALILIGLNMFSGLRKVDLANFTDGLPVLMMVMITLIANSFGTGIAGGLLFYIVIKAIAGKWRDPDWPVGIGRPAGVLLRDLSQALSPSQCDFTSSYNKRTAAESCLRCGQIRFNGTTSPDNAAAAPQAPRPQIVADVEHRFIGNALPGDRQPTDHLGVVAHHRAGNLLLLNHAVEAQRPAVERTAAQNVDQRIVLAEFLEGLRFAMAGDPLRRGHQHPTIFRRHRQRDKRSIVVIAIAKRNVHRIFKHVGQLIGKEQPQAQRRVALAEIAEQGQEQVTPEVRRHGNLQHAANFIVRGLDLLQTGLEGIEHLGGVGQPGLPSGVRRRLRVERANRRILRIVSRRLIAALTCAGCCPASRAASLKLPSAAARTNKVRSSSLNMPILPCFRLLPKYASPSLQRKRHKTCAAFCLHF